MMFRENLHLVGLVVLLFALFHEAWNAKGQSQNCSSSSWGNLLVSTPYRLKGAPGECGCGDDCLELACENNRTTLFVDFVKYYVQEIDYFNHTIRIMDTSLDRNTCFIPRTSLYKMRKCYNIFYQDYDSPDYDMYFMNCALPVNSSLYVNYSPCVGNSSSAQNTCLSVLDIHQELLQRFHDIQDFCLNILYQINRWLYHSGNYWWLHYSNGNYYWWWPVDFCGIRWNLRNLVIFTGQGGFGSVFKGKLRSGNLVAIKVLNKSKANGQDFMNEVATIGRIHHVNVVQLIGFCAEGYIAPELFYKNIGGISYKADVYSFGMLLMEMVGRRKNVNTSVEQSSQIYFPSWIYDKLDQGEDLEVLNAIEGEKKTLKKMIIVAFWCIQMKPINRPSMRNVLEMLEGSIELLQMPPKPFFGPEEMSIRKP
uniref:Protein kinase domain-containing protein n=1 Tax=Fagus sylvatica TaxID=28930 RepID=A0A2N9F4V5_FAGSY